MGSCDDIYIKYYCFLYGDDEFDLILVLVSVVGKVDMVKVFTSVLWSLNVEGWFQMLIML